MSARRKETFVDNEESQHGENGVTGGAESLISADDAKPHVRSPFVSVVIPCRNEAAFIGACLDSLANSSYSKEHLEIVVVDGMSEDGTASIVGEYARRYPFIRCVANMKRITPAALNTGIRAARGEIIVRMDAHARVDPDYISKCASALDRHGADNVGGIMKTLPQTPGLIADGIVQCLSHGFGVGNSRFRVHTKQAKWVDTVFGGCYRRELFDRIGWFNESLARGQDMEFNLRLRKAGGRILLMPDIVSYYYAHSNIAAFWRHNWNNGVWAILPFARSRITPVSWRHLVPLVFVSALIGSALFAFVQDSVFWRWFLFAILFAYMVADLAASFDVTRKQRNLKYLLLMPWLFPSLHVAYGMGSLWGLVRLGRDLMGKYVGTTDEAAP